MTKMIENTQYGFRYGAATVTRIADVKKAGVFMEVTTPKKNRLQIRVTPSGIIKCNLDKKTDNIFRV